MCVCVCVCVCASETIASIVECSKFAHAYLEAATEYVPTKVRDKQSFLRDISSYGKTRKSKNRIPL